MTEKPTDPARIASPAEAVKVLNRHRWLCTDDWELVERGDGSALILSMGRVHVPPLNIAMDAAQYYLEHESK